MKLTPEQLKQFEDEGWFFLPDCFSEEEVSVLRREAEQIFDQARQEIWREKSGAPRTAFACHTYNDAFAILARHPRLAEPVEQVFGEQLSMHQFKANVKATFDRHACQWLHDYG